MTSASSAERVRQTARVLPPEDEIAAIEAWHERCVERTFDGRVSTESWGRMVWTPGIADPEWNHAAGIAWREDELEERLAAVESAFALHGRAATVVVAPWTTPPGMERWLRGTKGWSERFCHLWSFYDLRRPVPLEAVAPYAYTRIRTSDEMEEFVALFQQVYGEDGQLAQGYGPALRRSLGQPGVRHHLIRLDGVAVAIGTLIVEGERAQIFNMVVHPEHRRIGLAEWLLNERLVEARAHGARSLTALSDNLRIDRWLQKRGFEPGWFTVGYAQDDESTGAG